MTNPSSPLTRRTLLAGSAAAAAAAGLGVAPTAEAVTPSRRVDFAVWDPIDGRSETLIKPERVTMHIADLRSPDIYGPGKGPGNSYAHFYNPASGAPRQHQTLNKRAEADLNGSSTSISVEHSGKAPDSMTNDQLNNLAKIFAWAHVYCGVANRIATIHDLRGLAWHRLGVAGNFGTYNPNNRTTWCRTQTGAVWSSAVKTCPTNNFINQIPVVFDRAQTWINIYEQRG